MIRDLFIALWICRYRSTGEHEDISTFLLINRRNGLKRFWGFKFLVEKSEIEVTSMQPSQVSIEETLLIGMILLCNILKHDWLLVCINFSREQYWRLLNVDLVKKLLRRWLWGEAAIVEPKTLSWTLWIILCLQEREGSWCFKKSWIWKSTTTGGVNNAVNDVFLGSLNHPWSLQKQCSVYWFLIWSWHKLVHWMEIPQVALLVKRFHGKTALVLLLSSLVQYLHFPELKITTVGDPKCV